MGVSKPSAIFITGVAGFIGSSLAERLLEETSYHVIGVDNFHSFYSPALKLKNLTNLDHSDRFTRYEASFEDPSVWAEASFKFDIQTVIHLAAFAGVRPSLEQPQAYYENNVLKTVSLLENMRRTSVKNIIFTSSSSVYGGNMELPFKESHAIDRPLSPYAATKKAGEDLISTYCYLYGMKAFAYRLFTVFGPRQRPDLAIRKFIEAMQNHQPITLFGDGSSQRDYTFIDDVTRAYALGLECLPKLAEGQMEALNIGSGRPISLLDMVRDLERSLGEKAQLKFAKQHPADLEVTLADLTKAGRLIGYAPKVSFSDGVDRLRDWSFSMTKPFALADLKRGAELIPSSAFSQALGL